MSNAVSSVSSEIKEQQAEAARGLIFFLFLVSGFAALTYQIVWQRALFAIYGINVESVTVVVSAFMLGLGVGSIIGGHVSTLRIPLIPVFGLVELGTGAFGFVSLRLFNHVATHTVGVGILATGLLAFLLVLIPTILMGSTLPILITYCVRSIPNVGRWTGGLYYVNTLGSAAACFCAAIFGMRLFGESGWVMVAACINTIVGTIALMYNHWRKPVDRPLATSAVEVKQTSGLLPFPVGVVIASVGGLIALSYEIIWYRAFSFSTATRSWTFAYFLGMYLLGIAFGSLVAERICHQDHNANRQGRLAALLIIAGNLAAFAVIPLMAYCTRATRLPLITVLFVPLGVILLGTIFPLSCHLTVFPDEKAGSRISELYFSNIVGSTLGSFVVGFVVMDFLSTAEISVLLVVCGTLLGFIVLLWSDRSRAKSALALGVVSVAIIFIVSMSYDKTYEHLLLAYEAPGSFEFLVENKSGVIAVLPDKTVIGGGAYDGRFNTDPVRDTNGIFRAYALSALHARPTDVLMIGLSSGSWAQVIVNNPEVSHLDIVEINPGYLSMIPRYVEVRSVLSNTKVTINIDDGRRWLRRHPGAKFDAIVMNTTWHWRANVTNLLSTEFLELIRQHLKPGGVFYYNTTDSPEAQITGATVFPYLVRISNFVAVSDTPITVSKQRWLETMHEYMIDGRRVLDPKNGVANQVLLDKYAGWVDHANGNSAAQMIEYGDTIRARYKGRTVITDDNMACEWRE